MKQLKRLDWLAQGAPPGRDSYWKAFWRDAPKSRPQYQGYVTRVRPGLCEARAFGGRALYGSTMHAAARRLVAQINNVYPSQLPR